MSAFKQKLARLGATAGVLAASTAAIFAVGGATASSALAVPPPNCVGGAGIILQGEGSTLQGVSQTEWTKEYNKDCPTAEKINFAYTGTGSGAALKEFGYTTGGGAVKTSEAFVGTDEAPEAKQITEVHKAHSGVNPVIVPVAQTSIAVVAHLPAGCSFTSEKGISWKDLNKIFSGKDLKWSEVGNTTGCGEKTITRVVRKDGSGTTYQFKNYLSVLQTTKEGVGPGEIEVNKTGETHKCEPKSWAEIRKNGGEPNLNLAWPETLKEGKGCAGNGTLSPITRAEGGGGVVNAVKATEGTIGYASYSDVVNNTAVTNAVRLQNLGGETTKYALPGQGTESKEANCGGRIYAVPSSTTGLEVDWSNVFGAKPNIGAEGATLYPLCTLTYDLSWHGEVAGTSGYQKLGYSGGATTGSAVKDYLLNYVLETALGQTVIKTHGYQALPSVSGNEVLQAAQLAAGKIN